MVRKQLLPPAPTKSIRVWHRDVDLASFRSSAWCWVGFAAPGGGWASHLEGEMVKCWFLPENQCEGSALKNKNTQLLCWWFWAFPPSFCRAQGGESSGVCLFGFGVVLKYQKTIMAF